MPIHLPVLTGCATRIAGADLRVGDVLAVSWFGIRQDIVTELTPYTGPLAYLFPEGASIARFAVLRGGMTIDHGDRFELLFRAGA